MTRGGALTYKFDPKAMNSYGFEGAYRFNRKFTLAGWANYATARSLGSPGDAEFISWAVEGAFHDLGKRGNLLGVVYGQPTKVISDTYVGESGEPDTSHHYEVFYRYPVNDFISITPGLILITNPENNTANGSIFVGSIRTTFLF